MGKSSSKIRIVLTGGGSGGHVTPLLAIGDALKESSPDVSLLYIGVKQGLESTIVPRLGIPIYYAPSIGMPLRSLSPRMLRFLFTLILGILKATFLLMFKRPHAIIASGGFASAPTVFAASLLGIISLGMWKIPIYMHEQNAVPGRMNRFAGRLVNKIGVSHPSAVLGFPHKTVQIVGYPVRSDFETMDRSAARKELGLKENDFYILVTGGSQGARTINRAMVDALPTLLKDKDVKIIHACGTMSGSGYNSRQDTETRLNESGIKSDHYKMVDYLHDLPLHLAASDLAIIRAGAGSIVEVCSAGIPALVIPKANLPGDSQVANARDFESRGAIEIIYESPCQENGRFIESVDGEKLANRILDLKSDPDLRAKLKENALESVDRNAAKRVAKCVLRMGRGVTSLEAGDLDEGEPTELVIPPKLSDLPVTATGVRRYTERKTGIQFERAFIHGTIQEEELECLKELDYIRYRGASLLAHSSWVLRNEGVKLVGLTRNIEKKDLLLSMLTDRTPAPPVHRLLGGDFYQVGFIRRNVLNALAFLGEFDKSTLDALYIALSDPYYEVRAWALKFTRYIVSQGIAIPSEIVDKIESLASDKRQEVRWEAIHTLGHVADPERVMNTCRKQAMVFETPIRESVLRSYHALLSRFNGGVDQPWLATLEEDLNRFAITSVAFHPHFPLKEHYAALRTRIREGSE